MNRSIKLFFFTFNLIGASLALLATSVAAVAETSAIVDTEYVVEAIKRNAIIWDTRSAGDFKKGHIPGAVNIDDIGVVLRDENSEDYIELEKIGKLLGVAGIDPSKEIVVYGVKASPYAYFEGQLKGSELSIYIFNPDGARVHIYAARGAVTGAEGFFVRRSIASRNSSTSKGFASIMSTFNSS